jgi:predicted nucleotidyltransferase
MGGSREVQATIQGMVGKLRDDYAPRQIILFGSYARGNPRADSDVDLLVIKDTSERFLDRLTTVRRILSDAHRTTPIEVLVLTPQEVTRRLAMGDQFLQTVLREGKVLYAP